MLCGLLLSLCLPAGLGVTFVRAQDDGGTRTPEPVLIPWERTLEDAEAISRASGRPLLICVNTDGEAASEFMLQRRYNDPEFAALVRGFVPILLSPDRHTPRDWDEAGRRIPCPRFGTVVCSEHIDSEPLAYERYFDGLRVAPRHLAVSAQGEILFDLNYLPMESLYEVEEALAKHGRPDAGEAWERYLEERSSGARTMLECAYLASPARTRRSMLERAGDGPYVQSGLFRLGLNEGDAGLRDAAALALARSADAQSETTLLAALRLEHPVETRAALLASLERTAHSEAALRVVADTKALAARSTRVDLEAWQAAAGSADSSSAPEEPIDEETLYRRIDELARTARATPTDPGPELEIARAWLELGRLTLAAGKSPSLLFLDARSSCDRAAAKGAPAAPIDALRAQIEWMLGEPEAAAAAAESALPSLREAPPAGAVEVLAIFAQARASAIYTARAANRAFAPELLSDAHSAFEVLAGHPLGTAEHARMHADLLLYLDLTSAASEVLRRALARFPTAPLLHESFRRQVAASRGIPALERAYAEIAPVLGDPAVHAWFAGYALLVVAEDAQRSNEPARADSAYARATAHFESSVAAEPDFADTANHYVALALAARARLAVDRGDLEVAVSLVSRAILARPESAEWPDGLQRTPLDTLRRIRQHLAAGGPPDLAAVLEAAVAPAAPELWQKAGL